MRSDMRDKRLIIQYEYYRREKVQGDWCIMNFQNINNSSEKDN